MFCEGVSCTFQNHATRDYPVSYSACYFRPGRRRITNSDISEMNEEHPQSLPFPTQRLSLDL